MKKTIMTIILVSNLFAFDDVNVSKLVSVYDGDTFKVNINSYPSIVGKKISIRVRGIDTPELRTRKKCEKLLGYKAKEIAKELLLNSKVIELRNIKRGKYFRIVADVYLDNNVSYASELLKSGLAVPYDGGHKSKVWCSKIN